MPPFDVAALWKPNPIWRGKVAYLIGGGSSLKTFDFNLLKGRNVIGSNYAFKLGPEIVPWICFSDSIWFQQNIHELERYTRKGGHLVSASTDLADLNLPWVHKMQRQREGLFFEGGSIGWNYNTGAMAINLALYFGANQIFLLGYDMEKSDTGRTHWHNNYGKATDVKVFARHINGFDSVKKGLVTKFRKVRVFNVTDGSSKLTQFDTIPFDRFCSALKAPEGRLVA